MIGAAEILTRNSLAIVRLVPTPAVVAGSLRAAVPVPQERRWHAGSDGLGARLVFGLESREVLLAENVVVPHVTIS